MVNAIVLGPNLRILLPYLWQAEIFGNRAICRSALQFVFIRAFFVDWQLSAVAQDLAVLANLPFCGLWLEAPDHLLEGRLRALQGTLRMRRQVSPDIWLTTLQGAEHPDSSAGARDLSDSQYPILMKVNADWWQLRFHEWKSLEICEHTPCREKANDLGLRQSKFWGWTR